MPASVPVAWLGTSRACQVTRDPHSRQTPDNPIPGADEVTATGDERTRGHERAPNLGKAMNASAGDRRTAPSAHRSLAQFTLICPWLARPADAPSQPRSRAKFRDG